MSYCMYASPYFTTEHMEIRRQIRRFIVEEGFAIRGSVRRDGIHSARSSKARLLTRLFRNSTSSRARRIGIGHTIFGRVRRRIGRVEVRRSIGGGTEVMFELIARQLLD
jgi:hypothetical protein